MRSQNQILERMGVELQNMKENNKNLVKSMYTLLGKRKQREWEKEDSNL